MIPLSAVLELVFTAQPMTAQRAYDIGFLNKVVPGEDLMEEAMGMAQTIAENAPLAVQSFKELAYRGLNMSTQDISSLTYHMYDQLLTTEDSKEGPKAFAEKRKPQWQGR
jgi:crotonobetainyl-CoA hydratase